MIFWDRRKDDETVAQIVAPGSNGKNVPLSEAVKKYLAQPFPSKAAQFAAGTMARKILRELGGGRPVNNITVRDVKAFVKRLEKAGASPEVAASARGALAAIIRLEKTGEAKSRAMSAAVEGKTQRLKIAAAPLSKLAELIGPSSMGRFAALKSDVSKAVKECPPTEFRTVYPSKLQLEKEAEREAARNAVQQMLSKIHPGWIIRWAAGEEVFVVVREKDWKEARAK